MDELIAREFQAIRDLIAANEARRDAVDTAEREQRKSETQALDSRLNRMNEFRQAMADQASRFITRQQFEEANHTVALRTEAAREYSDQQLAAQVDPIRTQLERMDRPDWGFMTAIGSFIIALIAGGWLIIGLEIDNKVGPLRVDFEQNRTQTAANTERLRFVEAASAASTQADTVSRTDRAQLSERVHQLETVTPNGQTVATEMANLKSLVTTVTDRLQGLRSVQTEQRAALVEIETQFCGQDNLRSQIHAQQLRVEAMLWKKVFDTEMPIGNAFYAHVGRCNQGPTGLSPG
jgi:hypothetical protein